MIPLLRGLPRLFWPLLCAALTLATANAEDATTTVPPLYDADTNAVVLARRYLSGGDDSRAALLEALQLMGWSVRNAQGNVIKAAPAGADTGLALRDYELEELLWKPSAQPAIRLISVAQAYAVPIKTADPEELAQDIVEMIRTSATSERPQVRFWGQFVAALGRVSPAGYDLLSPAPLAVIPPTKAQLQAYQDAARKNPMAMLQAFRPTPVWPTNDPVLAPSPRPKGAPAGKNNPQQRDQARVQEISEQLGKLANDMGGTDEAKRMAAQQRSAALYKEMSVITQRMQAAMMQQTSQLGKSAANDDEDESANAQRFTAEWRDQPLSFLQIALITRVVSADLRRKNSTTGTQAWRTGSLPPLGMLFLAQAGGGTSFNDQFVGAAGDIWATTWGGIGGAILEHHFPDSSFGERVAVANVLIAWFKTIMSVARQNITVDVENVPLIRTKTRSPGEQRTARAKVQIEFPKSDVLKAIRAAANISTLDLQLPDGGPVSGAKVVWRLPEGSYNTKYQTGKGEWSYRPDLAVVQFAQAGGPAAYISTTNDDGEATITLEGVPQRKDLSKNVRPYPRRAVVAVEVTIKVGNLTQDLNDAINTAMGGPIGGGLSFIADMVLRTSFFFQKGRVFEVTDWKEPAWQGEFEITVKGSGSKHEKGEKGGPDVDYSWSMDRYMEGRLHTPDWAEETEGQKDYGADGRHALEVDGDSRFFRLTDSSHEKSRRADNRYEANGPVQIQPPGYNQLELRSRAEPSGSAELMFTGGMMQLDLRPFFGAQCIVARSEQNGKRSSTKSGVEYLSLLGGVSPDSFTLIEQNDGSSDVIEGTKTFDGRGELPYVPSFDVKVTVKYRL